MNNHSHTRDVVKRSWDKVLVLMALVALGFFLKDCAPLDPALYLEGYP